ncbi:TPA: hypothetical protein DCE37_02845 [Candidatus Latescibacteria bacterium]|nr:hypothetical protein [Candidatus Latescibacterota bacterium]
MDDREDRREEEFLLGRTPVARRRDDAKESKKKTTNHLCQGYGVQEYTKVEGMTGKQWVVTVPIFGRFGRTWKRDGRMLGSGDLSGRILWGQWTGMGSRPWSCGGFEDVDGLTVDRIRVGTGEGGMVPTVVISRGETDRVTVALSAKGKGHIVVRGGRRRL